MENKFKPENVEEGRELRKFIGAYIEKESNETLREVLQCLVNSQLTMPANASVKEGEKEKILADSKAGRPVDIKNVTFAPQLIRNEEEVRLLPLFSAEEMMTDDVRKNHSQIKLNFFNALDIAEKTEGCNGIVVDVFTQHFVIKKELFDTLREITDQK